MTWALPFHAFAMAVLFGLLRFSSDTVRTVAAWKEVAVIMLLSSLILRAISGRGARTTMAWADLWVLGLLALATSFLVAGETWFHFGHPVVAIRLGFRDIAFFLLLYFVGRMTSEVASDPRTLKRLYRVALVTTVIAIAERIFITPEQLALLGINAYFQDFLGLSAFTTGNEFGLPHSYWSRFGGREVQRAGSVFLSGQGMAVPFLLLLPAATGWLVADQPRSRRLTAVGYALIWIGFLLSLTRMTIIACVFEVAAFALILRRPIWGAVIVLITGGGLLVSLLAVPGLVGFLWDTLAWQSGSSLTHAADWARGYEVLFQRPLGSGLGTTDLAAVRAGLEPLTIDNQYLKYAVELGIPGLILHLGIFAAIVAAAARVIRVLPDGVERTLAVVVIVATFGILINAMTSSVFNSLPLAYLYFWLAGAIVTVSERLAVQPATLRALALSPT